jgi:exopolyphosphatase/guanosine-5'-triphosphate,3'-diphosphate pyrophosphatase
VRDESGDPLVIRNDPILEDGIPMPTRYWLVGERARLAVDRLEAGGGVRAAEAAIDPGAVAAAHERYATERDAHLPAGWNGPRPTGGVGGTRKGIKCLHAHYAWYLAGGDDPVGRWVAERLASPEAPGARPSRGGRAVDSRGDGTVAAVDCGTNSTRLLVASTDGSPLERLMRITRLGEGVDVNRRLSTGAIDRTLSVLREFREVMDKHGVSRVRMAATSAARDATNREDFFAAAEQVIGARPELLGGNEEGQLSFAGATYGLDPVTGPWLMADIGGGSTEIAFGDDAGGRPSFVRSLDVGCVRITERFLTDDPPSIADRTAAAEFVEQLLTEASAACPSLRDARTLLGLAGTVAALAAIEQGLDHYDRSRIHHHRLTRATVEQLLEALAGESADARRLRAGMEHERADVIVGGAIVLTGIMRHFDFDSCLTSEADILDGMVMTLIG